MSPRARYRANKPAPRPEEPGLRFPWRRVLIWTVLLLGYATLAWYVIFPWVDRTFVNRPAL